MSQADDFDQSKQLRSNTTFETQNYGMEKKPYNSRPLKLSRDATKKSGL